MQVYRFLSSRGRRTAVRWLTTMVLLSPSLVLGFASTASAASSATQLQFTTQVSGATGGAPFTGQPYVTVEDSGGAPVTTDASSVTLAIGTNPSGGVLSGCTQSELNGVVSFSGCKINTAGNGYTLVATDDGLTLATSSPFNVVVGPASQLVIATQPSPNLASGTPLAQQPVVKVEDAGGNVVTSASGTASAAIASGTATITGATSGSFTNGVASFSNLTLTGVDTNDTLNFTFASFTSLASQSIAVFGAATRLAITTEPSSSDPSGAALVVQPVVQVEDAGGFLVADNTSTVTASITSGGAGTSVTSGTKAAVAGVAAFSGTALNALAGTGYSLTFTDDSLSAAVSTSISVTVGGAAKLAVVTQPSSSDPSGLALVQQPAVQIQDSGGNPVTTNTSTVTASFTSGGVALANSSATAVGPSGVATFSGLALSALAGAYTLTFSDGALTTATSNTITVGVGAATRLVITTQPSSSVATGVALTQQPVVKVEDSGGNVVTTNVSTVTATITSSAYTLSHGTAAASSGVATFSGLALNAPIGTYTLTFSDSPLSAAVSTSISVASSAATHLVITTQPSSSVASGAALAQQPVVKVEDASGNVVASDTSTVTAQITSGGVSVTNGSKAAVAGVAAFSGLALNALAGSYTITFTDGSLSAVVSSNVSVGLGAPAKLVITTEPSPATASGASLVRQPVVKVEDSGGNIVSTLNSGHATASIYAGSGGSISAGSTASFVNGVATFSGLALIGVAGTSYTLQYNGDGLNVIDTAEVTVGVPQSALSVTSVRATYGRTLTLTTNGGSGAGGVSYVVSNGTATGCKVNGRTLSYTSLGTCVVTAIKAADSIYLATSSVPTTVTIAKLPIPGAVTVAFTASGSTLSAGARNALQSLIKKLTRNSLVTVTGYAKGNLKLALDRATAVAHYLLVRLHLKVRFALVTKSPLHIAKVTTNRQ